MKAIHMNSHGAPDVLSYKEHPDPTVSTPTDILIEVRAASVNAADSKVRRGQSGGPITFPHILGRDFSGVILDAGPSADLKVGDEVFGVLPNGVEGAYAERLVIDAKWVALKPAYFSHVQAAGVGLAAMTALVALDTLKVMPGETLFVQGGAGGVGGFAIVLASAMGLHVVTTSRTVNHSYVLGLGAERAIDYTQEDPAQVLQGCDAVLDTIGGATVAQSFATLRSGGRAAFVGSGPTAPPSPRPDVVSLRPAVDRGRELVQRVISHLPLEAVAKVNIETMPLSQAAQAHERSEAGHVRGKIVLVP